MKVQLGCFGLPHKDGGYFFTIVDMATLSSFTHVRCDTLKELYDCCEALNFDNFENVREKWKSGYYMSQRFFKNEPCCAVDSYWDEDKDYPVQDWKYEISNDDTRLGYQEWVKHQKGE